MTGPAPAAVLVAGHLMVDPDQRAAYLERSVEVVAQARAAPGCVDFSMAADLLDPGRINIFEGWASVAAVEAFRGAGPEGDQATDIRSGDVVQYEIGDRQRLM